MPTNDFELTVPDLYLGDVPPTKINQTVMQYKSERPYVVKGTETEILEFNNFVKIHLVVGNQDERLYGKVW